MRTMPNFTECATHLAGKSDEYITEALRQLFEQGYQLGLNKGWAIEQNKELSQTEDK